MVYAYRRSYKSQIPSSGLTTNYSHDYLRQHCYSDRKEAESEFRKKTNGWWCVCSTWWPGKRLAECRSRFICSQGRRSANICWAENVLVLVRMNASPCERLKKKEKPFRTKKKPPLGASVSACTGYTKRYYYLNKHVSDDGVFHSLLMVPLEAVRQHASDGGWSVYRGYCVSVGEMDGSAGVLSSAGVPDVVNTLK